MQARLYNTGMEERLCFPVCSHVYFNVELKKKGLQGLLVAFQLEDRRTGSLIFQSVLKPFSGAHMNAETGFVCWNNSSCSDFLDGNETEVGDCGSSSRLKAHFKVSFNSQNRKRIIPASKNLFQWSDGHLTIAWRQEGSDVGATSPKQQQLTALTAREINELVAGHVVDEMLPVSTVQCLSFMNEIHMEHGGNGDGQINICWLPWESLLRYGKRSENPYRTVQQILQGVKDKVSSLASGLPDEQFPSKHLLIKFTLSATHGLEVETHNGPKTHGKDRAGVKHADPFLWGFAIPLM